MTPFTLIRGEWNRSVPFGLMFLWLLLAIAAIVLAFASGKDELLPVGIGVAVVFLVLAYTSFRSHSKQKTYLSATDTGFFLKQGGEETEHADGDLLALSALVKERHSNGKFVGFFHQGELVVAAGEEIRRIPFDYSFKATKGDALAAFFQRNLERLVEQSKRNLDEGRPLPGVGWRLTDDGLNVDTKQGGAFLAWDEIAAFYVVDDEVRVWRNGEEIETLSVPTKSMNANLLIGVLEARLAEKGEAAFVTIVEGTGLGRRIFERKAGMSIAGAVLLIMSLLCLALFGFLIVEAAKDNAPGGVAFCAVMFLLSIWGVVAGYRMGQSRLVVHERGVKMKRRRREDALRFDQIGRLGWAVTAMYHNGAYAGSMLKAEFEPLPGSGAKPIKFGYSFKKSDPQMDSFRDGLSSYLGARMYAEVRAGKSVPWAAGVVFHPDAVYCPKIPAGFLKKTAGFIPYTEIASHGWGTGSFGLFIAGSKKAVVEIVTSKMNFFPGYHCALMLLGAAAPPPQESENEAE